VPSGAHHIHGCPLRHPLVVIRGLTTDVDDGYQSTENQAYLTADRTSLVTHSGLSHALLTRTGFYSSTQSSPLVPLFGTKPNTNTQLQVAHAQCSLQPSETGSKLPSGRPRLCLIARSQEMD
jgi:hypothetical protein